MNTSNKILSLKKSAIAGLCFTLLACGGDNGDQVVSSTSIPTNQIFATIDVYSDTGDKAYARVQLTKDSAPTENKSGDDYIEIRSDEQLWMTTGVNLDEVNIGNDLFAGLDDLAKSQELFEGKPTNFVLSSVFFFWSFLRPTQIFYNGNIGSVEDGAIYTISLFRDEYSDAKNSTVMMPLAFDLIEPTGSDSFSRSNDSIQIEWLPMENGVSIEALINTSCPGTIVGSATFTVQVNEDDGILVLDPGSLTDANLTGTCTSLLTLAKRRTGNLDAAYIGGYISANQVRSAAFTTVD